MSRPAGLRKFVFLFVGGAIRRKGVDVLLEAFKAAFDDREDVSLLLAVCGSGGAYAHNSLVRQIQLTANDSRCARVQMLRMRPTMSRWQASAGGAMPLCCLIAPGDLECCCSRPWPAQSP